MNLNMPSYNIKSERISHLLGNVMEDILVNLIKHCQSESYLLSTVYIEVLPELPIIPIHILQTYKKLALLFWDSKMSVN